VAVLNTRTNWVRQIASIVLRDGLVARSAREADLGLRLLAKLKLFGFYARCELDIRRGRLASAMPVRPLSHVRAIRFGGTLAGARKTSASPFRYLVGSFHATTTGHPFPSPRAPSLRLF
jgi:hypothetical protein